MLSLCFGHCDLSPYIIYLMEAHHVLREARPGPLGKWTLPTATWPSNATVFHASNKSLIKDLNLVPCKRAGESSLFDHGAQRLMGWGPILLNLALIHHSGNILDMKCHDHQEYRTEAGRKTAEKHKLKTSEANMCSWRNWQTQIWRNRGGWTKTPSQYIACQKGAFS